MEKQQELQDVSPSFMLEVEAQRISYEINLDPHYIRYLDSLSQEEMWTELDTISSKADKALSISEKSAFYRAQREVLTRIATQSDKESKRTIVNLQNLVEQVDNPTIRENMIAQLSGLEKRAKEGEVIQQERVVLEIEQRKMEMQLEAEERRAKTRFQYLDRFLERESAATILGGIILIILTIALLLAMYSQERAREIVYSGFLILLGYFFGQTAGRATNNRNSTE